MIDQPKLFYAITTLKEATRYGNRTLLFSTGDNPLTLYESFEVAREALPTYKGPAPDSPLLLKFETPFQETPNQISVEFLTQVGHLPSNKYAKATRERLMGGLALRFGENAPDPGLVGKPEVYHRISRTDVAIMQTNIQPKLSWLQEVVDLGKKARRYEESQTEYVQENGDLDEELKEIIIFEFSRIFRGIDRTTLTPDMVEITLGKLLEDDVSDQMQKFYGFTKAEIDTILETRGAINRLGNAFGNNAIEFAQEKQKQGIVSPGLDYLLQAGDAIRLVTGLTEGTIEGRAQPLFQEGDTLRTPRNQEEHIRAFARAAGVEDLIGGLSDNPTIPPNGFPNILGGGSIPPELAAETQMLQHFVNESEKLMTGFLEGSINENEVWKELITLIEPMVYTKTMPKKSMAEDSMNVNVEVLNQLTDSKGEACSFYYFITSTDEAQEYGSKNIICDFTPFRTIEEAIEAAKNLPYSTTLIGKLELPENVDALPTQAETANLTQLGHSPIKGKSDSRYLRMLIRQRGLSRLSVVPWDQITTSTKEKRDLETRLIRLSQEVLEFHKDNDFDFTELVQDPDERQETYDLHEEFSRTQKDYDQLKKSHGFTPTEEKFLLISTTGVFAFERELRSADARRTLKLAQSAVLPESQKQYLDETMENVNKVILLDSQLEARTRQLIKKSNPPDHENLIMVELGDDELEYLAEQGISRETIGRLISMGGDITELIGPS